LRRPPRHPLFPYTTLFRSDITHVVLTHMHGDHIGGLTDEAGNITFANAAYTTGQTEYDHWAGQANEGFDTKVRPLADRMNFIGRSEEHTSELQSRENLVCR